MKLLCDHMLGSLAKWLRIFGFDTLYPDATTDDDLILQLAKHEKRLLISRDKELIIRGKKVKLEVLEIQTTDLHEQLAQVLTHIQIDCTQVLTRCTLCNTPLLSVEKKAVKTHVPSKVFETRDQFWYCAVCNKYYWMGTHYENMIEKINELTNKNKQ
ncbi:MAG: Mut7-C RNAse domain-containing protein [Thermoplasmata archaeon]|nr:Mut7-C RNAse domain-containing protein [Thermoplasmata archaeon]MBE3139267.1 Mut7-C RNAse domain-containing protein [Thermoplasmata archaeon]